MGKVLLTSISVSAAFSNNFLLSNPFPYVGFMVARLTNRSKEEAGYLAGLLAASFMFARIPASVVWGFMADRVGRKPVLILGCLTMFLFQILFGLSTSFEVAVLARLLMGLFSGVVGTSKTVASELAGSSPKEQALAMNVFSGASNLGLVLGPAMSGILYDPVGQYPGTFLANLPLVKDFPFFLPNLVSALVSLFSAICIWLFVPETLPDPIPVSSMLGCGWFEQSSYTKVDIEEDEEGNAGTKRFRQENSGFMGFLRSIWELWKRPDVRIACNTYSFYSFISIAFTEVFPLWLLAKVDVGGFDQDAKTIGLIISISAILLLAFQTLLFPYFAGVSNPRELTIGGSIVSLVFYAQLPLTSYLKLSQYETIVLSHTLQRAIQNILNIFLFTQINVMVNNSCVVYERGSVNGIVMSVGSLYKALGPVFAGSVFAWSINNGVSVPPFNFCLTFFLIALFMGLFALYVFWFVPEELNHAKQLVVEDGNKAIELIEEDDESQDEESVKATHAVVLRPT